jgi:hypothetical protein
MKAKNEASAKESTSPSKNNGLKEENENLLKEVQELQSQLKGMDILLNQNNQLEKEVTRLCTELDQATMGILKNGYLHKWREREIYYAPKWGLRYFVLSGNKLSYYGDEHERRPRRAIELSSKCFIKEEGTKKNGLFHVFSIYLKDENLEDSLVLKLSTDNAVDAVQWIEMLRQACSLSEESEQEEEVEVSEGEEGEDEREKEEKEGKKKGVGAGEADKTKESTGLRRRSFLHPQDSEKSVSTGAEADNEMTTNNIKNGGEEGDMSPVMLQRVRSTSKVLKRSRTRLLPSSSSSTVKVKESKKGADSKEEKEKETKKAAGDHKHGGSNGSVKSFPAYKPMHTANAPSPLSSETRSGEYSYRGFFNLMVIILGLTHCELIVNNISKYGLKLDLVNWIRPPEAVLEVVTEAIKEGIEKGGKGLPFSLVDYETSSILRHFFYAILVWFISILSNFFLEKFCATFPQKINEKVVFLLNFFIGSFNILVPCYFVWTSKGNPGINLLYLFQSIIIWMKLISYSHANKDLRRATRKQKRVDSATGKCEVKRFCFLFSRSVLIPFCSLSFLSLCLQLLAILQEKIWHFPLIIITTPNLLLPR